MTALPKIGLVASCLNTEHIRGMVAATMAHLSIDASAITQENAAHWQQWALGVADGVERGLPAVV